MNRRFATVIGWITGCCVLLGLGVVLAGTALCRP